MSWMKRAQGGGAPPEQQRYAAPQVQPFGNQQNMYTNYQSSSTGAAPPQQFWQAPPQQPPQPSQQPPQYNQQYGQVYQQVDYRANANQYYQQQPTQYNQNYPSQDYGNNVQQGYQQNYYPNQSVQQQHYSQNKGNTDGWEDNWDWGWEDTSKAQKEAGQMTVPHMTQQVPHQPPQQMYNNANVIEESFATTDGWNWSMEEKQGAKEAPPATVQEKEQPATLDVGSHVDNNLDNETTINSIQQTSANTPLQSASEDVKTLNDKEVVKERMPNLALGKRFHLDNLTPQWSIESQMSQDSSDGPLTQSEGGTFRSELQSRNSDKSNYSQHSLDEPYQNPDWSRLSTDEPTLADNTQSGTSKRESHADLTSSMQEMSIAHNEKPTSDSLLTRESNSGVSYEQVATVSQAPLAVSPSNLSTNVPANQMSPSPNMPLPPVSSVTLPPPSSSMGMAPTSIAPVSLPPSSAALPSNFPSTVSSQNPFKHGGSFSHKSSPKVGSSSNLSGQPFPPPMSNTSLTSPTVVNKVSQHSRAPPGFGANLETTPDNSERPDQPQVLGFRPLPVAQHVPENLEVAPKNDRNEYLQTAHLSSGDYGENTDFSRNIPPPGLRRMVVGQQESEYSQSLNMSGDEPPPGFARMVLGQQNEAETIYNQTSDNYLDRHIDGQPTDNGGRPYRRADGQQTPDNYAQTASARGGDRRPVGLDRMVPGEPSNDQYPQYQAAAFADGNEQRVVMGVDHDYSTLADGGPSDVREQNVDGSDYTGPTQNSRSSARNVIGARDSTRDISPDFNAAPEEGQREVVMEGENLQDLSIASSTEVTLSREHALDGADVSAADAGVDRKTDASDSLEHPAPAGGSRRATPARANTSGDDSERDRLFESPRRERRRDKERDRDKEGRYSRTDRKYEREGRERRERDERRPARSRRYDTEDTDYYSDRERERRRHREGSYSSKPPRPEAERERRRYETAERERSRRYDGERRGERRYRDIDPSRKRGNLQRERDDERRRGSGPGSPGRASSREPRGTDDERERRRGDNYRRSRHARNYYDGYAAGYEADPYLLQRQQYQYYEHLRHTNPAAYMEVYKQVLAGQPPPPPPPDYNAKGFISLSEYRPEERGSVHSGRSSGNDLKGNDTLYYYRPREAAGGSLRTDGSDRDLNTDASLNLHLEESTVRSERMTPCKFSTAHIKGSVSSRNVVVVRPSYPVDGLPATVHVLALAALAPLPLDNYPGPLLKGVTHKKSVVEYCQRRARSAARSARDPIGAVLLWDLLALLLRQNGVVVGTDIAELLMKNKREYEYDTSTNTTHDGAAEPSPRDELDRPQTDASADLTGAGGAGGAADEGAAEGAALERLRELLIYGNRQEAIEWAMSRGLWGHAMQLAAHSGRRARAAVTQRFVARLHRTDPLHTLYAALQARAPPAATGAAEERWPDWRPHAAIVLANGSASPDQDRRTLLQLGDSLSSRGLVYSAQFCYISGGEPFARHPLAPLAADAPPPAAACPPRLTLLLADPRAATLAHFATNEAIFATEIYEYAMSLNQDYVIEELQVYKLVLAARLCDAGEYERALAYGEQAARCVTRAPHRYSPRLLRALADLADRLKYVDPALTEPTPADDSGEPSPDHRHPHQWLDDVKMAAEHARLLHNTRTWEPAPPPEPQPSQHATPTHAPPPDYYGQQYGWTEQQAQQLQQQQQQHQEQQQHQQYQEQQQQQDQQQHQDQQQFGVVPPSYGEPPPPSTDEPVDYSSMYYQPPAAEPPPVDDQPGQYWPQEHYQYTESAGAGTEAATEARPMITMPGGGRGNYHYDDDRPPSADQSERDTDTPRSANTKSDNKSKEELGKESKEGKRSGWLGGLFTKLSLRPPNQMILPDDKNPTIVWDEQNKRWRNTAADDDEPGAAGRAPPPPPALPTQRTALAQRSGSPPQPGAPPAAPVSNIFKMQKGRHIKNSYVDVLNPGAGRGAPPPAAPGPAPAPAPAPPPPAPPSYFVPAPMHQIVVLPPSPTPTPLPPPTESGAYDDVPAADDYQQYRTGI